MKTKFILTGTENNGFRHRYSIKKSEGFKKAFLKFMIDLEFNEKEIEKIIKNEFTLKTYVDTKGGEEEITQVLEVKDIVDICRHYENKKYDVDAFYGKDKIIIVARTKFRVPMVRHLEKKSGWIKPIEIKKIREEKKKNKLRIPIQKMRA